MPIVRVDSRYQFGCSTGFDPDIWWQDQKDPDLDWWRWIGYGRHLIGDGNYVEPGRWYIQLGGNPPGVDTPRNWVAV